MHNAVVCGWRGRGEDPLSPVEKGPMICVGVGVVSCVCVYSFFISYFFTPLNFFDE